MRKSLEQSIFRKGSTTYYFSSIFFPRPIRTDVFKLYSFVRLVDDLVDKTPPNAATFALIQRAWQTNTNQGLSSPYSNILKNIRMLCAEYSFDKNWVDAFLASMHADLELHEYKTIQDSLGYAYGSAEVVGLMMAKVMRLPAEANETARLQGRAMQWINFIRDVDEDNQLGRCYFPQEDLQKFGLLNLKEATAKAQAKDFVNFMRFELSRYRGWQKEAEAGLRFIPRRMRIPLQTAIDMYSWTADQIEADPLVVFEHKIKPTKHRVISRALKHTIL